MLDLLRIKEILNRFNNYQTFSVARKETAKCLKKMRRPSDNFNVDSRIKNLEDNNIRVYYKIN